MRWKGISIRPRKENLLPGLMLSLLFAFEFVFLFLALGYTSVSRVSVLFYMMPIWLAISAPFLLPNSFTKRRLDQSAHARSCHKPCG
jgi:drug/metabolite transporter (DMT)-like permease